MRVLFASLATVGHAFPLIPVAVAAQRAGCEVHFAAGEAVHGVLGAHGVRAFRPADCFSEIYAEDIEEGLRRVRPDLVVHEWGVPGVAVAAHRHGIPGVWHGFGRYFPDGIGLELPTRIPGLPGLPHIDICPPSLQDKAFLEAERIALRPMPYSEPGGRQSAADIPECVSLIYLTLGSVFATPELLTTAINGLAHLDAHIVVATGRLDPRELGPLPGNVSVRAWVPQGEVIRRAELVVHHGGSGTMLDALNFGVPQLVLPQGADQFANTIALEAVGAGIGLMSGDVEAGTIADCAARLLPHTRNPYRDASEAIAAEIARMPGPDEVVSRLREVAGR
ncbi:glycosyltransferase [Nocardia sp. ET3-3]|uniref:Glycosyltransferase n=1 Tax=Nocardia terrae TaxID=2675851 RepID=A0A7K1V9R5_9NOCA|nr:nucleotide disphospho-sugar-binding domain-containing protein [Nocardia terrae]MVU83241.1 glycosyltransferase [Nocardia terrae]